MTVKGQNTQLSRDSGGTGKGHGEHQRTPEYTRFHLFSIDCLKGKSRKHNHTVGSRLKYQKIYQPFEYIHSDAFGPVQVSKPYPNSFVAFTDEATRFRWVYPLTDKSADTMPHIVTSLIHLIKRQFRATVLCFQCDHGREYDNQLIQTYLKENGIQCIFNSVADSASNGVAERANLTLLNDCRTLLTSAKLPNHLWFYAIQFSTIIRNSVFNTTIQNSPRVKAGLPGLDVKTILPFGQPVIVHLTKTTSKLQYRGEPGFALTPSDRSYGYLIYLPSSRKIIDTTNYAVVKHNASIDADTEYDNSILDPLFNDFNDHEIEFPSSDQTTSDAPQIPTNNIATPTHDSPTLNPAEGTFTVHPPNTTTITSHPFEDDESDPDYIPPADSPTDTDIEFSSDDDEFITNFLAENQQPETHTPYTPSGGTNNSPDATTLTTRPVLPPPPTLHESDTTIRKDTAKSGQIPKPIFYGTSSSNNTSLGGNNTQQRQLRERLREKNKYRTNKKTGIDVGRTSTRKSIRRKKQSPDYDKAIKHSLNYIKQIPLSTTLFYDDAITYNDDPIQKKLFQEAYDKELSQLNKMGTWDETPIDINLIDKKLIINSMFIFNVKRDGTHKSRLVARGDQQKPGTYKEDMTANTVHQHALMTCLSNCLNNSFIIIQLDISSAYFMLKLMKRYTFERHHI